LSFSRGVFIFPLLDDVVPLMLAFYKHLQTSDRTRRSHVGGQTSR